VDVFWFCVRVDKVIEIRFFFQYKFKLCDFCCESIVNKRCELLRNIVNTSMCLTIWSHRVDIQLKSFTFCFLVRLHLLRHCLQQDLQGHHCSWYSTLNIFLCKLNCFKFLFRPSLFCKNFAGKREWRVLDLRQCSRSWSR
jgi:hypothetical protein